MGKWNVQRDIDGKKKVSGIEREDSMQAVRGPGVIYIDKLAC
jgi:hypothetical protein